MEVRGWTATELERRATPLAGLVRRAWRIVANTTHRSLLGATYLSVDDLGGITREWLDQVNSPLVMGYVRRQMFDAGAGVRQQLGDVAAALDVFEMPGGADLVRDYLRAVADRLQGAGADVWLDAREALVDAQHRGLSVEATAEQVRSATGITMGRARRIARTEVHAAQEAAAYAQVLALDPDALKIWNAEDDGRTRHSHWVADGRQVKITEPFIIGGYALRFPGDPYGPAHEIIQCRCQLAYDVTVSDIIPTMTESDPSDSSIIAAGADWDPLAHPRGLDGRFIEKGLAGLVTGKISLADAKSVAPKVSKKSWDNLTPDQQNSAKVTSAIATADLKVSKGPAAPAVTSPYSGIAGHDKAKKMPGDPAKVTTTLIWGKHKNGQAILIAKDGSSRVVWNDGVKRYVEQSRTPDGGWQNAATNVWNKKDAYEQLKNDDTWLVPIDNGELPQVTVPQVSPKTDVTPAAKLQAAKDALAQSIQSGDLTKKSPAIHKGKNPGDPAKVTTTLIWGKRDHGQVILISQAGAQRVRWNDDKKRYERQARLSGEWHTADEWLKKEAYKQLKNDTHWVVPGNEPPTTLKALAAKKTTPGLSLLTPSAQDKVKKLDAQLIDGTLTESEHQALVKEVITGTPEVTPKVAAKKTGDFSGFKKVGGQQGSNLGGWFEDENGDRWYVKKAKSDQHAANEQLAARLYALAWIDTPQIVKGKGTPGLGGGTHTATPAVPDAKSNLQQKLYAKEYLGKLREGFAVDAWLANWDVAGLVYDNVVEDDVGQPIRIDVGGALLFRAQGAPKGHLFGNTVTEIDTLRDPGMNPQSTVIFGSMTDDDVRESSKLLLKITPEMIDTEVANAGFDADTGQKLAETLKARRAGLLERFGLTDSLPESKLAEWEEELLKEESTPAPVKPTTTSPTPPAVDYGPDDEINWHTLVDELTDDALIDENVPGATVAVSTDGQFKVDFWSDEQEPFEFLERSGNNTWHSVTTVGPDPNELADTAYNLTGGWVSPHSKPGKKLLTQAFTSLLVGDDEPSRTKATPSPTMTWDSVKPDGKPNWSWLSENAGTLSLGQVVAKHPGTGNKITWDGKNFVFANSGKSVTSKALGEVSWATTWQGVPVSTPLPAQSSIKHPDLADVTTVKMTDDEAALFVQKIIKTNDVNTVALTNSSGNVRVRFHIDDGWVTDVWDPADNAWDLNVTNLDSASVRARLKTGNWKVPKDLLSSTPPAAKFAGYPSVDVIDDIDIVAVLSQDSDDHKITGQNLWYVAQNSADDEVIAFSHGPPLEDGYVFAALTIKNPDGTRFINVVKKEVSELSVPDSPWSHHELITSPSVLELNTDIAASTWLTATGAPKKIGTSTTAQLPPPPSTTSEATPDDPIILGDISGIPPFVQKSWKSTLSAKKIYFKSSPEKIWAAVSEIAQNSQAMATAIGSSEPGYSPLQILKSLDAQTKTQVPNPWTTKVTKWAGTAKGAAAVSDALFGGTSGTPTPTPADEVDLGDGDVADLDTNVVFTTFKSYGTPGAQSSPEKIWNAIKGTTSGLGISPLQVLRSVDAVSASKANATNDRRLEKKIVEWSKTPDGIAVITGKPKPKPGRPVLHPAVAATKIPSFTESEKFTFSTASEHSMNTHWEEMVTRSAAGTWTTVQRSAVKSYTGGTYHTLNSYLRGKESLIDAESQKTITEIQLAMRPTTRPMIVHRGTGWAEFGLSHYGASAADVAGLVGQVRQAEAFTSTSVGGSSAFGGDLRLMIEVPPGTPIVWAMPVSQHPIEREVILAAGTKFQIISADMHNGVRVRVVP